MSNADTDVMAEDAETSARHTVFGSLHIAYDARVLEPRAWTVAHSQWAADLLTSLPPGPVLELCAGAGQIGLLAVQGTGRQLVQVDANPVAGHYARRNAEAAGLGGQVEVREGPMERSVHPGEEFALVVADPPYIPSAETSRHPDDPLTAIDGGRDGLAVVRTCLEVIAGHLSPRGAALLQVADDGQARAVDAHLRAHRELDLAVVGHRLVGRGALVHLVRGAPGPPSAAPETRAGGEGQPPEEAP